MAERLRVVFLLSGVLNLLLLTTCQPGLCSYAVRAMQIQTQASIWEVHLADLDHDGRQEMVLSGFDNKIHVTTTSGKSLWTFDLEGFPIALATGDVVGSSNQEVVVVSQDVDHTIYLLEPNGHVIQKRALHYWATAVCIGDINADGSKEIILGDGSGVLHILDAALNPINTKRVMSGEITALAMGDIRRDSRPELLVGGKKVGLMALSDRLKRIWRAKRKVLGKRKTRRFQYTRSIVIGDLDGNGSKEVIVGSRPGAMVSVYAGSNGRRIWRSFIEHRWSYAHVTAGNYFGDRKLEIVALRQAMLGEARRALPQLVVFDYTGKVVIESHHRCVFYSSDSADVDHDGYDEIVLSSPRRGRHVYILNLDKGSGNQLETLAGPPHDAIDRLLEDLKSRRPSIEPNVSKSHLKVLFEMKQPKGLTIPLLSDYYRFLKTTEGDNIEFIMAPVSVGEERTLQANLKIHPYAQRYIRTKSKINNARDVMAFVKQFRDSKIPFMPLVGQQSWRLFSIERLEDFIKAAPNDCRGFFVFETNLDADRWPGYLDYLVKVAGLCRQYRKKFVMVMHKDFWRRVIARPDFCGKMLIPEFSKTLVPMFKSTGMRSPALNIGAILGLWKTGMVDEWGMSVQEDGYMINSWFVGAPDDIILRGDVLGAALGATWFRIELSMEFLQDPALAAGKRLGYAPNTRRHRGLFQDLIRRHIIRIPETPDQVTVSSIALQPRQSGPVTGTPDFREKMRSVGPDNIFHSIYQLDRFSESFFPRTPIGYVALLPYFMKRPGQKDFKDVLVTDGRVQSTGMEKRLAQYASRTPFSADGVCLLVNRFADEYRLYLICPQVTDIHPVQTELKIRIPGPKFFARDLLTNQPIAVIDKKLKLTVPAGTFRLVSIQSDAPALSVNGRLTSSARP